jgi:hypothetical protein
LALRQLRDRGLLEAKGSSVATHYVLGPAARPTAAVQQANRGELPGGIDPNRGELETNRGERTGDRVESDAIPADLLELIQGLGRKPPQARLRHVLLRLAELRPYKPSEFANLIGFSHVAKLTERHLAPMVSEGLLVRIYPNNPTHTDQVYVTCQATLDKPMKDPPASGG